MGVLDFLFGRRTGDEEGSSPGKAIVAEGVGAEYAWMKSHCPGFQPGKQSVKEIGGKPYDILTWRNGKGEERTVYFDISGFYNKDKPMSASDFLKDLPK